MNRKDTQSRLTCSELLDRSQASTNQNRCRVTNLFWLNDVVIHAAHKRLISPMITHDAPYVRENLTGAVEVDQHQIRLERVKDFFAAFELEDAIDVVGVIKPDSCRAADEGLVDSLIIDEEN